MKEGSIDQHFVGQEKPGADLTKLKRFFALLYQIDQRNLKEEKGVDVVVRSVKDKIGENE